MRRGRFSGLADPMIPRKAIPDGNSAQRSGNRGASWGWLEDQGNGQVRLRDRRGKTWSMDKVRVLSGSFGSADEGFHRALRPHGYVPGRSARASEGDYVLIVFIDGDPEKPVIMGGAKSLRTTDPDFFPAQPLGTDPDPVRGRLISTKGGHIQFRGLDNGGDFELEVGGGTFGVGLRIKFDFTAGTITLAGNGVATDSVPLGRVMAQAIGNLAADLDLVNAAIPAGIPVVPALMHTTQIIADVATSVAGAGGPPLLSAIVKLE